MLQYIHLPALSTKRIYDKFPNRNFFYVSVNPFQEPLAIGEHLLEEDKDRCQLVRFSFAWRDERLRYLIVWKINGNWLKYFDMNNFVIIDSKNEK